MTVYNRPKIYWNMMIVKMLEDLLRYVCVFINTCKHQNIIAFVFTAEIEI